MNEVPPNSTVVGVPGRIVKRDNVRVPQKDLDQVHLPDPVLTDITELKKETAQLRRMLELRNIRERKMRQKIAARNKKGN